MPVAATLASFWQAVQLRLLSWLDALCCILTDKVQRTPDKVEMDCD